MTRGAKQIPFTLGFPNGTDTTPNGPRHTNVELFPENGWRALSNPFSVHGKDEHRKER